MEEDLKMEEGGEADRSADGGGASEPGDEGGPSKGDKKALKLKARAKKLAAESEERHRKRGVCYLSRVPPHLKPLKLRHMLEQFGVILRVYLAPEGGKTVHTGTTYTVSVGYRPEINHRDDCCTFPLQASHSLREGADAAVRLRRKRGGGNSGKNFTEG